MGPELRTLVIAVAVLLVAGCGASPAATASDARFVALCYHNVEDTDPDQTFVGVSTSKFVAQLSWLERSGYHFLSVDDLLAAQDGRRKLPEKAVLLTFDDGYESFYTRVFPILKAFHAPAVLGLVGAWMAGKAGGTVVYGDQAVPRELFMSWDQVREVVASGLVEVASHSNDLHRGLLANPQGNLEPAAVTRGFDARAGYETEDAYRRRIDNDSETIARTIARETGRRPRVMIWPYGEHNGLAVTIEAAHGMPMTFTLTDGSGSLANLSELPRHLVNDDPSLATFVAELRDIEKPLPVRVIQVDLDYVYDPDPAQQERNLGMLVQRVRDLAINTVYLQAFADPQGSGLVRQVYFPNRQLPMRADLFNRAAWQLRTRAHVRVYAWMPVLAIDFGISTLQQVIAAPLQPGDGAPAPEAGNYQRLSPFDPDARRRIRELYEDLAASAAFDGLLFHDDAMLSDYEDASAPALDAYARAGLPRSIAAIRADKPLFDRWTSLKTETLIAFTQELAQAVRRYRSPLRTARNIYARPVLEPASAAWFAQDYDRFLAAYDYVAIMAMPRLEGVPDRDASSWLRGLFAMAAQSGDLGKTIFEMQSVDWRKQASGEDHAIPSETLAGEMRLLERLGGLNLGYYPDDFLRDQPRAAVIHPAFSLQSHPYRLP